MKLEREDGHLQWSFDIKTPERRRTSRKSTLTRFRDRVINASKEAD